MKVHELMTGRVISVTPEDSAASAARLLDRHNVGALPVCTEEGRLRGIITDRDLALRCMVGALDPEKTPVREVMSRGILTATPDEDVKAAALTMAKGQIRRMPVVDGGRVVGMLSLGDLARDQNCKMEASAALSEISTNLYWA